MDGHLPGSGHLAGRTMVHGYSYRHCLHFCTALGKQILEGHYSELKEAIASGTVDDNKAVGLLDQWIIEGKYSEEEALVLSCDMLAAGMDTVSEGVWSCM